ncbi:hypothetical protein CYY_007026 [Polysphondylium violaceum]|uniref:TCTP domain-containing protein n=1 Tax=Polysphondylium violaceum TaxID=133409 RepID=A0A8J4PYC9_9MYCE|nr:hypothetical protein CYY_007026 [Polysphondylium violaceum]
MKVFKDILGYNQDEVLSDAFDITELDVVYEVKTKMIKKDTSIKVDTGANASEEEEEEGTESSGVVEVNNLVDAHNLTLTSFDKKAYLTYIKGYMKEVAAKLEVNNPGRVEDFKKGAQEFIKGVVAKFDQYTFYQGENMDADGMVILAYYKEDDPKNPFFYYFKDGLRGEKY